MANEVVIHVRTADSTKSGLESAKTSSSKAGADAGGFFAEHFGKTSKKRMELVGKELAGVMAVVGAGAAASGLLAMAAPLAAAGLAVGAFGAVAFPVLKGTMTAVQGNTAAQKTYNDSIAKAKQTYEQQMAVAKTAAQQRAAGLTLSKAEANAQLTLSQNTHKLSGAQQSLVTNFNALKASFSGITTALTPMVLQVATLGTKIGVALMPTLKSLAQSGGKILESMLTPLLALFKSPAWAQFIGTIAKFASQIGPILGKTLADLVLWFTKLFIGIMPSGVKILSLLLPAIIAMLNQLTPIIVALATAVAVGLKWLAANHLLVPALWLVVAALVAMKLSLLSNPYTLIALAVIALAEIIIRYHKQIWAFMVRIWNDIFFFVKRIWNDIFAFAKQYWPLLFGVGGIVYKYHVQIWDFIRRIWNDILGFFKRIWNDILGFFRSVTSTAQRIFTGGWNAISSGAHNAFNALVSFIRGLPGRILGALGNAGRLLAGWGSGIIHGLLSGMTSVIGALWNFIKGIPGKILHFLGIKSPPQWAIDAGKHILNGFGIGMSQAKGALGKAALNAAQFSVGNLVKSVGGGVERWRATVLKALSMEGLNSRLVDNVLYQMQTESGGNPNAINLTDINAQRGDPSKGLMQVIGATFRAFHWPGTSWNIYDPLANIAAALHYARITYGPNLENIRGGIGSGKGYAGGGVSPGGWATVGEYGRELVRLPRGSRVYPHGQSESMLGMGSVLQVEFSGGQSEFDQFMLSWLRKHAKIKGGGNVQKAFGVNRLW